MTTMHWSPAKKAVAVCAAIGLGLLVVTSRKRWREHNGAPVVLDPDLDSETRRVVLVALEREYDPMVLQTLSAKLAAAGHDKTAAVVRERLISLLRVPHLVGQATGSSSMVSKAQRMLQRIGYAVPVTGIQDESTTLAVKRFQSLHDLDITGIVDEALLGALKAAMMHDAALHGQTFMEGT